MPNQSIYLLFAFLCLIFVILTIKKLKKSNFDSFFSYYDLERGLINSLYFFFLSLYIASLAGILGFSGMGTCQGFGCLFPSFILIGLLFFMLIPALLFIIILILTIKDGLAKKFFLELQSYYFGGIMLTITLGIFSVFLNIINVVIIQYYPSIFSVFVTLNNIRESVIGPGLSTSILFMPYFVILYILLYIMLTLFFFIRVNARILKHFIILFSLIIFEIILSPAYIHIFSLIFSIILTFYLCVLVTLPFSKERRKPIIIVFSALLIIAILVTSVFAIGPLFNLTSLTRGDKIAVSVNCDVCDNPKNHEYLCYRLCESGNVNRLFGDTIEARDIKIRKCDGDINCYECACGIGRHKHTFYPADEPNAQHNRYISEAIQGSVWSSEYNNFVTEEDCISFCKDRKNYENSHNCAEAYDVIAYYGVLDSNPDIKRCSCSLISKKYSLVCGI